VAGLAAERRAEERDHALPAWLRPDDPRAQGQDVHVVVLDALVGRVRVVADGGADPADLVGGDGSDPLDDYPDFAARLGYAVRDGEADRGVLICGSGVGSSVAANKMHGIRSAVCHDTYSAHQGVEHDDMNVLTLGSRVIGPEPAYECAIAFLAATFSGAERHERRLRKVKAIEAAG
jgi:ribose 5-phosphate isomerase B